MLPFRQALSNARVLNPSFLIGMNLRGGICVFGRELVVAIASELVSCLCPLVGVK